MPQNPLDTYNLAELFGWAQQNQQRDLLDNRMRRELQGGADRDDAKEKARAYTLMRNAQRKADLEDEMEDARSVMSRAGEIAMSHTGLPGGGAVTMAQNEQAMKDKGMMGGQRVVGGGGGGGQEQNPFLSQAQADLITSKVDLARAQESAIRQGSEQNFLKSVLDRAPVPDVQTAQPQQAQQTQQLDREGGTIGPDGWGTEDNVYYGFGDESNAVTPEQPKQPAQKKMTSQQEKTVNTMLSDIRSSDALTDNEKDEMENKILAASNNPSANLVELKVNLERSLRKRKNNMKKE